MSPEPTPTAMSCRVLPMGNTQKYRITVTSEDNAASSSGGTSCSTADRSGSGSSSISGSSSTSDGRGHQRRLRSRRDAIATTATATASALRKPDIDIDEDATVTIDEVIEELANIVSDAEREINVGSQHRTCEHPAANAMATGDATGPSSSPSTCTAIVAGSASQQQQQCRRLEQDIVPVNLLPQPPRKSRSLVHLLSQRGSDEFDVDGGVGGGSDYGLMMMNGHGPSLLDDLTYEPEHLKFGHRSAGAVAAAGVAAPSDAYLMPSSDCVGPDVLRNHMTMAATPHQMLNNNQKAANVATTSNRELLNVIMDAREKDGSGGIDGLMMMHHESAATVDAHHQRQHPQAVGGKNASGAANSNAAAAVPAQKFSGVFFMAAMSSAQKYPKPDITAALEARRVTKNLDRMESYGSGGIDSMIDIVMTETAHKQAIRQQMSAGGAGNAAGGSILLTGANHSRFPTSTTSRTTGKTPVSATTAAGSARLTDLPCGLY